MQGIFTSLPTPSSYPLYRDLLSAFGLGQKKINTILGKEDVSDLGKLDELLSEDDTVTECKSQNQKLMEFLTKRENLSQLIKYATKLPKNISSKDHAYK